MRLGELAGGGGSLLAGFRARAGGEPAGGPGDASAGAGRGAGARAPAGAPAGEALVAAPTSGVYPCLACGVEDLGSLAARAEHGRTDWHRLNAKRRAAALAAGNAAYAPLGEDAFDALVTNDDANDDLESISGSEDEEGEVEDEGGWWGAEEEGGGGGDEGGFSGRDEAERPGGRGRREARGRAHFVDAEGRPFWVWRAALGEGSGDEERLSSAARGAAAGEPWAVVLAGGGHFAAAVYGMAPGKGKGPATSRAGHVALAHKTVHRYVTRRKAGGRQSTKDAQSGTKAPKSVGASLRREMEVSLENDIRATLREWSAPGGPLERCTRIVVAAPGPANQANLFGPRDRLHPGPISRAEAVEHMRSTGTLHRQDSRVRAVPFTTRRATFSETQRVIDQISLVRYSQEDTDENESEQGEKADRTSADVTPAAADGEGFWTGVPRRERASRRVDEEGGGGEEGEYGAGPVSDGESADERLHAAAVAGDVESVRRMLYDENLDPTVRGSRARFNRRVPYNCAGTKEVRDVFRRLMADRPGAWDWQAACVPSALTEAMVEEREREREQREREIKAEKNRKARQRKKEKEVRAKEMAAAEAKRAEEEELLTLRSNPRAMAAQAAMRRLSQMEGNAAGGSSAGGPGKVRRLVELTGMVLLWWWAGARNRNYRRQSTNVGS